MRSRASRLCRFSDVTEVEAVLSGLASREDGPYVVRLAREPGKRESRYAHLFSGAVTGREESEPRDGSADFVEKADAGGERLSQLEQRVADLETEVAGLKKFLGGPTEP